MIYAIFRFVVQIAVRLYYGKIEVQGVENIPKDGPLLVASNHPNGFMEPLILAIIFKRPLHFMVRGDVFEHKFLKPLMIATNQIPIYRFRDGLSKLRKNEASLDFANEKLKQGAAILLFVEGSTINSKQLRPLQKGLARMAYDFVEQESKILKVLPVGINFIGPRRWRSRVQLNIGTAFEVSDSKEAKTEVVKSLTDKLRDRMKDLVLHIESKKNFTYYNHLLFTNERKLIEPPLPIINYRYSNFDTYKQLANKINLGNNLSQSELLNDKHPPDLRAPTPSVFNFFMLLLLLPAGTLGFVLNYFPVRVSQWACDRYLDHENKEFEDSIRVVGTFGIGAVYYLIMIVLTYTFAPSFVFLWYIGLPLGIAYIAMRYYFYNSLNRKALF